MKGKHQDTKALSDVLAEMQRQDAKWGADRNQDPFIWGRFSEKRWENFIRLSSMIVLVVKQPVPVGRKQYKLLLLHCKSSNIMIA